MTDTDLDLEITRTIRAPRARVWQAWADPAQLARWWLPAPAECRVVNLDLVPGGGFETEMREDGGDWSPHLSACFLDVLPERRIVYTNALTAGWRPAAGGFVTGIVTLEDAPDGTLYRARALHKDRADRDRHAELGFHDGWGTVAAQLAALVEA